MTNLSRRAFFRRRNKEATRAVLRMVEFAFAVWLTLEFALAGCLIGSFIGRFIIKVMQ